jgi:hypothetical protein
MKRKKKLFLDVLTYTQLGVGSEVSSIVVTATPVDYFKIIDYRVRRASQTNSQLVRIQRSLPVVYIDSLATASQIDLTNKILTLEKSGIATVSSLIGHDSLMFHVGVTMRVTVTDLEALKVVTLEFMYEAYEPISWTVTSGITLSQITKKLIGVVN